MPVKPTAIDLEDVQGIVLRGYGRLKAACSLLLRFEPDAHALAWLADLRPHLTSAATSPTGSAWNVGFTRTGLERMELPREADLSFDPAFVEGMTGPKEDGSSHRSRLLGDEEESAPARWLWGNAANRVDAVLLLFATDDPALRKLLAAEGPRLARHRITIAAALEGRTLPERQEHFGFRDGISQPAVRNANPPGARPGVLEPGREENTVEPGEFLLGHCDAYEQRSEGGVLPADVAGAALLPAIDPAADPRRHFGHDGSYLVLRQLAQDVTQFWGAVRDAADRAGVEPIWLASRLVGRWPSGAPAVLATKSDDRDLVDHNDFGFAEDDPDGVACPHGSHIRRANPRDWHLAPRGVDASRLSNRHRLIRRGRPYGKELVSDLDPAKLLDAPPDATARGLQFLCFNASIERQFEFVQSTWLDHRKFAGVRDESDPVLGTRAGANGPFTLRGAPFPRSIEGLRRFVQVRGGAYFFVPGLAAIDWLVRDAATPSRSAAPTPPRASA